MKSRSFGKLGWKVSEIGFGAWAIGGSAWGPQRDEDSLASLKAGLDAGMDFIDTAQGYGDGHSEQLIGQALRSRGLKLGGGAVRVASKIPPQAEQGDWPPRPEETCESRYSEAYLRERVERSLKDLGAEAIDLMQIHTWTRAWNRDPSALQVLAKLKAEGKILAIGVSTPEHDQNAVIDLMRHDLVDSVQVIYNIFERECEAELLPVARVKNVAVIARCPFDESSLCGKLKPDTHFADGDFRARYFKGDRLLETIQRVEKVRETLQQLGEDDLVSAALRFCLASNAVASVIPGVRTPEQARINAAASDAAPLDHAKIHALREHIWRRGFWYA